MAQSPQDFSLWMVHVCPRPRKCDKSPHIPLHASFSCILCDSVNGSSVYQLTKPRTSQQLAMSPCLLCHQPSMNPTVTLRVYIASGKFAQHSEALKSFRR